MAAVQSYDVVGKKEDISDIITMISPTKTPFTSLVGEDSIHAVLYQWQEDNLAAVNLSNSQVEGFVASDTAIIPTVMRTNVTQILSKTVNIATTTDTVARYGRAKEIAYQLGKYSAEVKRDLEGIMLSGQISNGFALTNGVQVGTATASTSVARTMASFQTMVDYSLRYYTGGSTTTMPESTAASLTSSAGGTVAGLVGVLQALYTNGVDPEIIMVPPLEGITIAGYASAAGRYRTLSDAQSTMPSTLVNVVDLYVSPYGEVKVILNRFQPVTDYMIFDPGMWKRPVLRSWTRETLAKVGDSTRMMLVGEFSLKHKNYFASAVVRKAAAAW